MESCMASPIQLNRGTFEILTEPSKAPDLDVVPNVKGTITRHGAPLFAAWSEVAVHLKPLQRPPDYHQNLNRAKK